MSGGVHVLLLHDWLEWDLLAFFVLAVKPC